MADPAPGSRLSSGTSTISTKPSPRNSAQPRGESSGAGRASAVSSSRIGRPPLCREQAARPLLDEQDDADQHHHLAQHGASHRLEELVHDSKRERADQRTHQVADAAEDDDEEAVDNVDLAKI